MPVAWKARKMVSGKDTIAVMAMHYGLRPSKVRDIIREAGAKVIREDGYKSKLVMVESEVRSLMLGARRTKVVGWEDGSAGVDPSTTKLTKPAIMAVALWKHQHDSENDEDN